MDQQPFIVEFNRELSRLDGIQAMIAKNISDKTAFTQSVSNELTRIRDRINALNAGVKTLTDTIADLQRQSGDNSSNIDRNTQEITRLTAALADITAERNRLNEQLAASAQAADQQRVALQTEIDTKEAQVRDIDLRLQNLNANLDATNARSEQYKAEIEELKQSAAANGNQAAVQHAEALEEQARKSQTDLAEQQQATAVERGSLVDQITQKEREIAEADNNIQEARENIMKLQQDLAERGAETQAEIGILNAAVEKLEGENRFLQDRIVAGTMAIKGAMDILEQLNVGNVQNISDVKGLLDEIEGSIETIARAIQGQAPAPIQGQASVDFDIQIPGGAPPQPRSQVLIALRRQAQQIPGVSAYSRAFDALTAATTQAEAQLAVNTLNMDARQQWHGGKKRTRKHRKRSKTQKGGFIYNKTSPRHRLKTTKSSSSKRTSTRSKTSRGGKNRK